MNAERLLQHFAIIENAPDAVLRLRRFVRDLAVRGKLVPQSPDDEPASVFLKRLNVSRFEPPPFGIPDTWAWVTVSAVAKARLGKMLDKSKNKGTPRRYLRNVNVRWFGFDLSDVLEMRFEDWELSEYALRSGDVLICEGGEPGRAAVWDEREPDIYFQKAIHRVRLIDAVDPHFFATSLRASADDGRLAQYFTGAGIKHFTGQGLSSYSFPLPPRNEQKRIIAKVDELMALCDRLEAAKAVREAARDRLVLGSLALLTRRDTHDMPGDARATVPLVLNDLAELTVAPKHISQLRQTILSLAVRGKLLPQQADNEPASAALKRGGLLPDPPRYAKRSVELIPGDCGLSVNDPKWTMPSGWVFVPLVKIARLESGHTPSRSRPDWWGGEVPWMGLVDARIHNNGTIFDTIQHTNEQGLANSAARLLPEGTVCFSRTASVGYVVVMGRPMATSQDFVNWVPTPVLASSWLQLVMMAERPAIGRFSKGAVHQTIYYPAWLSMHIVLPPLAEQHRIVGKVKELMSLCDRLEAEIETGREVSRRFLEATLHEALAPTAYALEAAQ